MTTGDLLFALAEALVIVTAILVVVYFALGLGHLRRAQRDEKGPPDARS